MRFSFFKHKEPNQPEKIDLNNFVVLPLELILAIIFYLTDDEDKVNLSLTCKLMHLAMKEDKTFIKQDRISRYVRMLSFCIKELANDPMIAAAPQSKDFINALNKFTTNAEHLLRNKIKKTRKLAIKNKTAPDFHLIFFSTTGWLVAYTADILKFMLIFNKNPILLSEGIYQTRPFAEKAFKKSKDTKIEEQNILMMKKLRRYQANYKSVWLERSNKISRLFKSRQLLNEMIKIAKLGETVYANRQPNL